MHWAGSLFLSICILVILLLYMPLRLVVYAEYHQSLRGEVTVQYLWMRRIIPLGAEKSQKLRLEERADKKETAGISRAWQRWRKNTSLKIEWKPLAGFLTEAVHIISRRARLEQLELDCAAGFSRPDITAYSYGLFWGVLSLLPEKWLAQSRICYRPDFQNLRFEFEAKSIISLRMGQAIGMMVSLTALWMRYANRPNAAVNTQNREEQIAYES
jgi:hypothetical protein